MKSSKKAKKLKIENCKINNPNFILVCIYPNLKKIAQIGFIVAENVHKDNYAIGVWRVKFKN